MNGRVAGIWWLHPAAVFGIAATLLGVLAYSLSESVYRTYWRTPKFFTLQSLELTLACTAVFVFGTVLSSRWMASRDYGPPQTEVSDELPLDVLQRLLTLSFWLCVLGYAIWVGLAVSRGMTLSVVFDVIRGEKGAMYDARFTYLPTVGGVTTLTQFGTAAMILGAIVGCKSGWRNVRFKLAVVAVLAFTRALVNSERFALIELVVPFLVTWLGVRYLGSRGIRGWVRTMMRYAPLLGAVVLFVLFTGFEYFRSWTNYYAGRDLNLLEFGAMRLFGYYVTSFNNGGYFLNRLDPLSAPYFTLHFLWGFPLTSPVIARLFPNPLLDSTDKWFYFPFLEADANLEYNNADGFLFPLMDFGVAGGLIYWLLIGILCGFLYESFKRKQLAGLLMYPATFLGLIELPLALYWGEGRSFPTLLLLAATTLVLWFTRQNRYPVRPLAPARRVPQTTI